mmetsp:Transcript_15254/g.21493  ORF Transcript_15254/g.21493 Transcript_15254/m.21493 type:complete len:347 (-) Transcript_15254:302-1342(-)|eukprot:CAMPEP_0175089604 /NCGR_PEP_ID=MMETSP0086_2-20121207/874_1 /TAXON_ID=136419 /ORGANISM="Unknown Unknown, Strain D1" /LENGTH=346 /DNA_ID=CAMNT_0016362123 /DNA_START=34 /DNA_END=1074 /DNA_ORIENTATION=+
MGCKGSKALSVDRKATLAVVGLNSSGKSTIASLMQGQTPQPPTAMSGPEKTVFTRNSWEGTILEAGVWSECYSEAHGVVFVVDASDARRLEELADTFSQISSNPNVKGKPILIFANKQDLPEAMSLAALSAKLKLGKSHHIVSCSATAADNKEVLGGLDWILKAIDKDFVKLSQRVGAEVTKQEPTPAQQSSRVASVTMQDDANGQLFAKVEEKPRVVEGARLAKTASFDEGAASARKELSDQGKRKKKRKSKKHKKRLVRSNSLDGKDPFAKKPLGALKPLEPLKPLGPLKPLKGLKPLDFKKPSLDSLLKPQTPKGKENFVAGAQKLPGAPSPMNKAPVRKNSF